MCRQNLVLSKISGSKKKVKNLIENINKHFQIGCNLVERSGVVVVVGGNSTQNQQSQQNKSKQKIQKKRNRNKNKDDQH